MSFGPTGDKPLLFILVMELISSKINTRDAPGKLLNRDDLMIQLQLHGTGMYCKEYLKIARRSCLRNMVSMYQSREDRCHMGWKTQTGVGHQAERGQCHASKGF